MLLSYPSIATQFASNIDISTLFTLSSLCKQIYLAILPNRVQLKRRTARCQTGQMWFEYQRASDRSRRVFRCARDIVKNCQRCGLLACRNCVSKPPHDSKVRFRQLCRKCQEAPLEAFAGSSVQPISCACIRAFWLCISCGRLAEVADMQHRQQLDWRHRYSDLNQSTLGVGFGHGIEGIRCGAGVDHCLGAYEAEIERAQPVSHPYASEATYFGYGMTEMEGIGGRMVEKVREKTKLAAYVENELLLTGGRSINALCVHRGPIRWTQRGWCSWCDRVIPQTETVWASTMAVPNSSSASDYQTTLPPIWRDDGDDSDDIIMKQRSHR